MELGRFTVLSLSGVALLWTLYYVGREMDFLSTIHRSVVSLLAVALLALSARHIIRHVYDLPKIKGLVGLGTFLLILAELAHLLKKVAMVQGDMPLTHWFTASMAHMAAVSQYAGILSFFAGFFLCIVATEAAKRRLAKETRELAREIGERKQAEENLERIFNLSPGMICTVGADGLFTNLNPAWEEVLGFTRRELLAKPIIDLVHPDDADATLAEIAKQANGEGTIRFENRCRRKGGSYRTLEWKATPSLEGVLYGVARDITERKRAEEALKKSEIMNRSLLEGSPVCNKIIDLDGKLRYMSRAGIEQLKIPDVEALYGQSYPSVVYPESIRAPLVKGLRRALEGKISAVEAPIPDVDGNEVWYDTTFVPALDDDGQVQHVIATSVNITKRRRAENERQQFEEQMQQAQKLESLGVMAGGIAHDFNNILCAILGNADLALTDMPPEALGRNCIQEIQTAARRASGLTDQMLAYSGKGALAISKMDLSELVREMAGLLEVSHPKKTIVKYRFDENLSAIEGDASQLRQVVMNLITNASEAVGEEGGIITLKTGVMEATQEYLATTYANDELPGGRYVCLEVTDTGCGMDIEAQRRIFEPFFTTKFTGRGLGMAAVLGIARAHRGAIDIQSEVDCGTTVKVLFPALDELVKPPVDEAPREDDWSADGTVLIVDDESQIRNLLKLVLERKGYSVLTADDGRQATDVFRENQHDIVCVLLDLTMPHMGGEETYAELRRIREDVRVILISGYSEEELAERVEDLGFAGFLKKPVGRSVLLDKLRIVLNPAEGD